MCFICVRAPLQNVLCPARPHTKSPTHTDTDAVTDAQLAACGATTTVVRFGLTAGSSLRSFHGKRDGPHNNTNTHATLCFTHSLACAAIVYIQLVAPCPPPLHYTSAHTRNSPCVIVYICSVLRNTSPLSRSASDDGTRGAAENGKSLALETRENARITGAWVLEKTVWKLENRLGNRPFAFYPRGAQENENNTASIKRLCLRQQQQRR